MYMILMVFLETTPYPLMVSYDCVRVIHRLASPRHKKQPRQTASPTLSFETSIEVV